MDLSAGPAPHGRDETVRRSFSASVGLCLKTPKFMAQKTKQLPTFKIPNPKPLRPLVLSLAFWEIEICLSFDTLNFGF
jgi:hypothetical protein